MIIIWLGKLTSQKSQIMSGDDQNKTMNKSNLKFQKIKSECHWLYIGDNIITEQEIGKFDFEFVKTMDALEIKLLNIPFNNFLKTNDVKLKDYYKRFSLITGYEYAWFMVCEMER